MEFLERNLEDILFDALQSKEQYRMINDRGLCIAKPFLVKRQLRIGNYGTCDLITLNRPYEARDAENFVWDREKLIITVYELKQNKISFNSLLQLIRYMRGITRWMDKNKGFDFTVRGILIGKSIDVQSDYIYLFEYFSDNDDSHLGCIDTYSYNYKIDGIEFKQELLGNYSLSNEGF